MEEEREKIDKDTEALFREYQEGKISKVELDKKWGNLANKIVNKIFPITGFFKFNGQIFMGKQVVKKSWMGTITRLQGYVFDKSIMNWKPVSKEIFQEAVEKGGNIKEFPEDIKNENKF